MDGRQRGKTDSIASPLLTEMGGHHKFSKIGAIIITLELSTHVRRESCEASDLMTSPRFSDQV